MTPLEKLQKAIQKTEVVRSPKQALSTFGQTQIEYYLVSELISFPDRSRLRHGGLVAQKPQIITPESMLERFEGFGSEGKKFGDWLLNTYGQELRGLHYKFTNQLETSHLENAKPDDLIDRINQRLGSDSPHRVTILKGPDESWQLSLLKFIIEMSSHSFRGNVQELEERGLFDPGVRGGYQRVMEIESLMKRAREDRSLLTLLSRKLKEYGMFEQYQDRFFNLARQK